MKGPWKDISVPIYDRMVNWPGDPAVKVSKIADMHDGDDCTVSRITMGTHTGTHMDAPSHFIKNSLAIDSMPFDATIGTARVVDIKDQESIKPQDIIKNRVKKGERILFKTLNSKRCWKTKRFIKDFVYISEAASLLLAKIRVKTVGIDYLSVGGFYKENIKTHKYILNKGVWIIEGLDLSKVNAGRYELLCLPLKVLKGDGAPSRAILRAL